MVLNPAVITITTPKAGTFSLRKDSGGDPGTFVHFLLQAVSGYRTQIRRHPGRLVALICASGGPARASAYTVYQSDLALDTVHVWRYEISYDERKPVRLKLTHISDSNVDTVRYDGLLELFFSNALRGKFKKPRGRTPRSYASRAEYETVMSARRPPVHVDTSTSDLKTAILAERKENPATAPDLQGVRVLSGSDRRKRRRRE